MFSRSRKGSMQLSIEAIIILVIAMVLLGLAIAFITGFFKQGTSKLTEPFDAISFGCDPSANDPIKTSPTLLQLKAGDTLQAKICVYNTLALDAKNVNVGVEGCVNNVIPAPAVTDVPKLLTQPQNIKRTETGGFNTILTAPSKPGTYICTLTALKLLTPATPFPAATAILDADVIGRKQVTITVT